MYNNNIRVRVIGVRSISAAASVGLYLKREIAIIIIIIIIILSSYYNIIITIAAKRCVHMCRFFIFLRTAVGQSETIENHIMTIRYIYILTKLVANIFRFLNCPRPLAVIVYIGRNNIIT